MANDVDYQLQEIKKYVQGICYPFFQHYRRIVDSRLETIGGGMGSNIAQIESNKSDISELSSTVDIHGNQLNALENTTIPAVEQSIVDLENSVITLISSRFSELSIGAGSHNEIDVWTIFDSGYDARKCLVKLRVLDTTSDSPTRNMYIDADAVATVAIRENRYLRVINNYSSTLQFSIMIK